ELSDVALAVRQKANVLMLGKETVYSKYPIESIRLMHDIICAEEKYKIKRKTSLPPILREKGRSGPSAGLTIAIEGPNGIGKSTLCQLLRALTDYRVMLNIPRE